MTLVSSISDLKEVMQLVSGNCLCSYTFIQKGKDITLSSFENCSDTYFIICLKAHCSSVFYWMINCYLC